VKFIISFLPLVLSTQFESIEIKGHFKEKKQNNSDYDLINRDSIPHNTIQWLDLSDLESPNYNYYP
jgi:hypothetical protein